MPEERDPKKTGDQTPTNRPDDSVLVSEEDLAAYAADADPSITHDDVRKAFSKVKGKLVDDIRRERDKG